MIIILDMETLTLSNPAMRCKLDGHLDAAAAARHINSDGVYLKIGL